MNIKWVWYSLGISIGVLPITPLIGLIMKELSL